MAVNHSTAAATRYFLFLLVCVVLWSEECYAIKRRKLLSLPEENETDEPRRQAQVETPTSIEDHRVTDLPFLDPETLKTAHYAGLLPASDKNDKYFFYWLFYPENTAGVEEEKIPLILWLNGGPGCSSMDGLFIENGPLMLTHDHTGWKMEARQNSWHKTPAYLLFVDQPVGTGLSFTTSKQYPGNDQEVNRDFIYWLREFLTLYKDVFLTKDGTTMKRPFYFSGESHAGHYIPSMMAHIEAENKKGNIPFQIPVSGAAIGNGWVDPYNQYAAAEAAYGHGIIDLAQKNALAQVEKTCQDLLMRKKYLSPVCFRLLDDIVNNSFGKGSLYKVSQYDVRKVESRRGTRDFPPGHKEIESFLGGHPIPRGAPSMNGVLQNVLAAIHASPSRAAGQVYRECTDPPYNALSHQDGKGVVPETVSLLNAGKRILFFNGIMDLICNHVGNEVMLQSMPWNHQHQWTLAKRYGWSLPSTQTKVVGYMKEYENLMFLKLFDSGHMVPLDIPEVALAMMRNFVYERSFAIHDQELPTKEGLPSCPVCNECEEEKTENEAEGKGRNRLSSQLADESNNAVYAFVIAHSWVGALLAVVVFGTVVLLIRRRDQRPVMTGGLEMKERYRFNQYRDSPAEYYRDEADKTVQTDGLLEHDTREV